MSTTVLYLPLSMRCAPSSVRLLLFEIREYALQFLDLELCVLSCFVYKSCRIPRVVSLDPEDLPVTSVVWCVVYNFGFMALF